jgi:NTP pyrophosphatase (non-canonical NTP hydrolase)
MTDKEKIEYIANNYGLDKQLPILAEECCELGQAALKLTRYPFDPTCKTHLYEELADVKIMVDQITHLIGAENIQPYITAKLNRQLERIK